MAKENPSTQQLERRIEELEKDLFQARERVIEVLEMANKVNDKQAGQKAPVNYDSPDFDDFLNKQTSEAAVVKGVISQVYYGRFVSIHLMGSGAIEIRQQSHHLVMAQTKDKPYRPTRVVLSQETFFLMLETMWFAENKFGLDRKAIINKLTDGGEFNFREAITMLT